MHCCIFNFKYFLFPLNKLHNNKHHFPVYQQFLNICKCRNYYTNKKASKKGTYDYNAYFLESLTRINTVIKEF